MPRLGFILCCVASARLSRGLLHPRSHRPVIAATRQSAARAPLAGFLPSPHRRRDGAGAREEVRRFAVDEDRRLLDVAVVGAGPSGLLLAHRLLKSGIVSSLSVFESRSDPRLLDSRTTSSQSAGGRAYAVGLGARGRSAVRTVDEELWTAVKARGYECEKFRLHLTPNINVKLRDSVPGMEPSLLIYQTDLCAALLDELDRRTRLDSCRTRVEVAFGANATDVDVAASTIALAGGDRVATVGPFDLIVGCDGLNSIVRRAMQHSSTPNTFESVVQTLPGFYKVARVKQMPPKLDPGSVALLLPKKGSITAFVEPTVGGGGCILFAGGRSLSSTSEPGTDGDGGDKFMFSTQNEDDEATAVAAVADLLERFPLLEGTDGLDGVAQQLRGQRANVASSVRCNVYHSDCGTSPSESRCTPVVLVGDAAHATGGVSGQGSNSALVDATVLADCLERHSVDRGIDLTVDDDGTAEFIHRSLLEYSQRQVPEGRALYDLSFGNDGNDSALGLFQRTRNVVTTGLDTLFSGRLGIGKPPLQTILATSLTPFAEVRRNRETFYVEKFPTEEWFNETLTSLYS